MSAPKLIMCVERNGLPEDEILGLAEKSRGKLDPHYLAHMAQFNGSGNTPPPRMHVPMGAGQNSITALYKAARENPDGDYVVKTYEFNSFLTNLLFDHARNPPAWVYRRTE